MNLLTSLLVASACVSGVYPRLFTFNREGECGTGAVVPWAGRLWHLSYAPHKPEGSTDLLYAVNPDMTREIRAESVGGTHANRMVHAESGQLFIGPYAIDGKGGVRTIPFRGVDGSPALYGRLTATARHLSDPAHKVYMVTMEEGLYEVDVDTLAVKELFRDGNLQGGSHAGELLPGYHGKGAYTAQGRLVYANNGELSKEAQQCPTITSGVLAEWNGGPGREGWKVVRRNQFTDVTSRGGIAGAADPAKDALWAVGWDHRSVLLMCLDGGAWHVWRLPKGSHSYDGAHGWNTEWPRIREIGEGDDYLMTMHGTFWRFPAGFDATHSAGIRPRSNYLKVIGDFCRWGDRVVMGCDDTAANEFLNKRRAKGGVGGPLQSNSNLWFVKPGELDGFGPAIGRGAVWMEEDVRAGTASDPYLLDGYDRRTLYLLGAGEFDLQVDRRGDGTWKTLDYVEGVAGEAVTVPLDALHGAWVRLVAKADSKRVTAMFNYANADRRPARRDAIFAGVAKSDADGDAVRGILRSGRGDENLPLEFATADAYYRLLPDANGELKLTRTDDPKAEADLRAKCAMSADADLGDAYDAASALVVDDAGRRWRFPYAAEELRGRPRAAGTRLCREVCTERDLLNLAGTFYELPAENAGGYAKARPVATHGGGVCDYCTWRGVFAISGVSTNAPGARVIVSDDGRAAVWTGVADDLWRLGKPVGVGGPWKGTKVAASVASDPYLMTGYDRKTVTVEADRDTEIRLEIDLTGSGTWAEVGRFAVKAGVPLVREMDGIRAYWVRAVAADECTATVQFEYR